MSGELRIPASVVEVIKACPNAGAACRSLYLVFRCLALGELPDMSNENGIVKMTMSLVNSELNKASRRREQNRKAWETFKAKRDCQEIANACQAKEENIPSPTPLSIREERVCSSNNNKNATKEGVQGEGRACQAKDKQLADATAKAFDMWWAEYPRKVAKAAARQSFSTLFRNTAKSERNALFSAMVKAVKRASSSDQWTKEGGKYIPLPTTWIHQRRWEDEGVVFVKQADERSDSEADMLARKLMGR